MAGSIKPSFFTTGPKEDMAVVDVYKPAEKLNKTVPDAPTEAVGLEAETIARNAKKKASDAVDSALNAIKSKAASQIKSGLDQAGADALKGELGKVGDYLGNTGDPRDFLGDDLADGILEDMGFTKENLKNQAIEIGASGLEGAGPLGAKAAKVARFVQEGGGNEVSRLIKNGDLSSASGVQNVLGALGSSQTLKVLDLSTQFSVLKGVVDKAAALGVVNVIDVVLDNIEDRKDKKRFLLDGLFQFFTTSDIDAINRAIDMIGAGGVLARVPDGINLLLRYYRYPKEAMAAGDKQAMIKEQYEFLVGTLERLDDRWFETTWGGVTRVNLEPYYYASGDAVSVLERNRSHYQRCVRAKQFGIRSIQQYCSANYPFLELAKTQ